MTGDLLVELADITAELLNWSGPQRRAEIERTLEILREKHSIDLKRPG